nr:transposase [Haloglycomyces albus]
MSEAVGHADPHTVQNFLMRATWEASRIRNHLTQAVSAQFGGPDAVLVVDDTGFVTKGQ